MHISVVLQTKVRQLHPLFDDDKLHLLYKVNSQAHNETESANFVYVCIAIMMLCQVLLSPLKGCHSLLEMPLTVLQKGSLLMTCEICCRCRRGQVGLHQ